jgi:predicted nucleic acid-binding protein
MRSAYENAAIIDTSAVLALHDPYDQFHEPAVRLFAHVPRYLFWVVLDITTHETYTRARYAHTFSAAMEQYNFLHQNGFRLVRYLPDDEAYAEQLLVKYADHQLSFHDVLCAAVMGRLGIYKIFSFDSDFSVLGFEVMPGVTR